MCVAISSMMDFVASAWCESLKWLLELASFMQNLQQKNTIPTQGKCWVDWALKAGNNKGNSDLLLVVSPLTFRLGGCLTGTEQQADTTLFCNVLPSNTLSVELSGHLTGTEQQADGDRNTLWSAQLPNNCPVVYWVMRIGSAQDKQLQSSTATCGSDPVLIRGPAPA